MILLPDLKTLEKDRKTVGELAEQLYPGMTYDTSLPQEWVNYCTARVFDPRGQVVWLYPDRDLLGIPAPLTQEAMLNLCALARIY